jgi:hypothetical protein
MARYKVLKSVAHNVGHSFMSLMNFQEPTFVFEHLFRAAAAAGEPRVRIDLLTGAVLPPAVATPAVQRAAAAAPDRLRWLAEAQRVALPQIREATLDVTFDFARSRPWQPDRGLVLGARVSAPHYATYTCRVRLVDDRGKPYEAEIPEWWRG